MPNLVALDAGPLVALFVPDDPVHRQAVSFLGQSKARFFTTVPVLTEVMYLLGFHHKNQLRFLQWLRRGAVEIVELQSADWERIEALLEKYADLRPDFADLSLVAACERNGTRKVASIDQDFAVYRYQGRLAFDNIFPS